jgi:hypothetical protein
MAWLFWRQFGEVKFAWVPTIQGWEIADYQRHAQELRPLIAEMATHYGPQSAWRVGIGSLCQRASVSMIRQVVAAVAEELPGVPLHLWGVSLRGLRSPVALPGHVVSCDSSSWNRLPVKGVEEWRKSGLSQRRWTITVALPRYLHAIEQTLATPKQLQLPLVAA